MRTEADRWLGAVFHGWVEMLTLFAMLVVMLGIIGWCWNRGLRPADRGPLVGWQLLVVSFALLLLVRHFKEGLWPALIIAGGVIVAGLVGRSAHPRGLWVPVMLLAALLGLGLTLSALVLFAVISLVLLFSAKRGR